MDTSLADIAAVCDNKNSDWGNGSWWIILLFLVMYGNNWGGNGAAAATTADIQRAVDLNSIQEGQRSIAADIQRTAYENMAVTKDTSYNSLSEVRDAETMMNTGFNNVVSTMNAGFANQAQCCCETQRAIDSVNYNLERQGCETRAAVVAENQKVLDALTSNRMAAMQDRINQLELNNALSGVLRYPMSWAYNAGTNPFCTCSSTTTTS